MSKRQMPRVFPERSDSHSRFPDVSFTRPVFFPAASADTYIATGTALASRMPTGKGVVQIVSSMLS